ncbi:hypothetical protein C8R44DRAFT_236955 [Mycena epipterygia]|nr:hypothetical protein C8R44DRAFT_236955 [Mycena epipterygia]
MDSPFQSMLHTNTAPSDIECDAIRALVAGLTQEIARIQSLIEDLAKKRDELNEFIDAHLSLVSPARRLPSDVVRAIFTASLPSTRNSAMTAEDSPLLLGQICSAWRELALSTPRLWSSLHIVVPNKSRINVLVEMVTAWLTRSGILPLSISIAVSKACEYEYDFAPILRSVTAFSPRWKSIHISLRQLDHFEAFASLSAEDVPMLQDVVVKARHGPAPIGNPPWNAMRFLGAPSLFSLSILEGHGFTTLHYPSNQLAHLQITARTEPNTRAPFRLTYVTMLGLLQQFPALETCDLDLEGRDPSAWTGAPVVLPHLHHFALCNRSPPGQAQSLSASLILPQLRSVVYRQLFSSTHPLPFSSLIPSLERLSLDVSRVRSTVLLDYLRPAQSLQDLQITGNPLEARPKRDKTFYVTHFGPGSEEPLCPSLRGLRLLDISISDDALIGIIQERMGPQRRSVARVMHFSATLRRERERDIMPELQPLIDEGLDVSIAYRPPPDSEKKNRFVYSPWEGTVDSGYD